MRKLTSEEIKIEAYNILLWFHNYCEKYNLKYSLAYGTLLGAIRHRDFIPWDDDIDVYMPREDYNKFLKLTQNIVNEKYIILSFENNQDYIYPFAKVYNNRTLIKEETCMKIPLGIYIDIFPLDKIPLDSRELNFYKLKIEILTKFLIFSTNKAKSKNFLKNIIKKGLFVICSIYGFKKILKKMEKIRKYYDKFPNKYISFISGDITKSKIEKNCFKRLIKVKFRGNDFYCYENYDILLKNIYGDYMTLPPMEKRVNHNMKAFYK